MLQIVDGIVQCWPPSRTCVANWDAWSTLIAGTALITSLLSVLVSALAAVAVYLLGRETNNLAKVTRENAIDDREREATFILLTMNSDVINTLSQVETYIEHYDVNFERFCAGDPRESPIFRQLSSIDLPIDSAMFGRLHVLDRDTGLAIVRARAQLNLIRLAFSTLHVQLRNRERMRRLYDMIHKQLVSARPDVQRVFEAASRAMAYRPRP